MAACTDHHDCKDYSIRGYSGQYCAKYGQNRCSFKKVWFNSKGSILYISTTLGLRKNYSLKCQMSANLAVREHFKIFLRMETLGALKMKSVSLVAATFLSVLLLGISSFEAQCIDNYEVVSKNICKNIFQLQCLLFLLDVLL